jgi:sulfur-oxidizing protein SoxY
MEKTLTKLDRRAALQRGARLGGLLLTLGLLPNANAQAGFNRAAFDGKSLAEVLKALGAGVPVESKDIKLDVPDIAENGAVVPVAASTALAGVRRLLFLVEKNPSALAAAFDLSDSVEANVATRVKMGQTSNVYAVALTVDNKVLFAQREVKVTLGGCGG